MDLDQKLKTALDESRLLILGAQVLFGFAFQAVFQDQFNEVPLVRPGSAGCGTCIHATEYLPSYRLRRFCDRVRTALRVWTSR
jgi:hypothetical protein